MRVKLIQLLFDLRHNYWFIPSVMAVAAVLLAALTTWVDLYHLGDIPDKYIWLLSSQADGARAILSTVAGSTITVAGVVFSMTLLSVSHATANYGSRLLLKFLDDRRNQFTLGTFTATFIYCLLILRTVSGAEDASATEFIPQLSVLTALALALLSVGVLIAYIHHIPSSIYIGKVTADRGAALAATLVNLFAQDSAADDDKKSFDLDKQNARQVLASKSGYIQALDVSGLVATANKHATQLQVLRQPGDFVHPGSPLIGYQPLEQHATESGAEDIESQLASLVGIGRQRTSVQDVRFLVEELQQIAARALSPGINDPFTAMTCLDQLANAAACIINLYPKSEVITDNDGIARVKMPRYEFQHAFDNLFYPLFMSVADNALTTEHCAELFTNLIECCDQQKNKQIIKTFAADLMAKAIKNSDDDTVKNQLKKAFKPLLG